MNDGRKSLNELTVEYVISSLKINHKRKKSRKFCNHKHLSLVFISSATVQTDPSMWHKRASKSFLRGRRTNSHCLFSQRCNYHTNYTCGSQETFNANIWLFLGTRLTCVHWLIAQFNTQRVRTNGLHVCLEGNLYHLSLGCVLALILVNMLINDKNANMEGTVLMAWLPSHQAWRDNKYNEWQSQILMPRATAYSKPPLSRPSCVPFPFIFPPQNTQGEDEETKVLRGGETCLSHRARKQLTWLTWKLTSFSSLSTSFSSLSTWYLMIRNQENNIQPSPFQIRVEPRGSHGDF